MTIIIKKNKKMDLKIPEFNCDHNPIGEHLNKYDMLKHLNNYGFISIIGKPGSGKTSLLVSFLTGKGPNKVFRKCFNHVLVVMPTPSRNSMKHNIFENHPEDKLFDSLTFESLNEINNKLHNNSSQNENTLLILDDIGASLKNKSIQLLLREIIYNRRHLKVQIVMLLQSFISIPKEIRGMMTNIFMFKPSKNSFEKLFEELFENAKSKMLDIMKIAFDEHHNYLMLNIDSQKMYKGFDEIILKDLQEE